MEMSKTSSRRSAGSPRTGLPEDGGPDGVAPEISVVIPVYNEEASLPELHQRTVRALEATGRPWELIYVDDGSSDRSLELLSRFAEADGRIRAIEFARNSGQHAAVLAGLSQSRGEVVITLDADLQNPPEEIPRLMAEIDQGFDVVGTRRRNRRDPLIRRMASRLVNRLAGGGMSDYGCMLRAYRRDVVDRIGECREISSFVPILANLYAKRVAEIDVDHAPRTRGTSKYGLFKLLNLLFDLVTGFSTAPLKAMTWFGGAVALSAFGLGLFLLTMRVLKGPEWAQFGVFTLFAVLFMMVGMLFIGLGTLGEYVGRIYGEVRQRPRYVIRKIHSKGAP